MSAADISRNFGDWQSKALQHPVTITHHGRPRLMLVSVEAFEKEQTEFSTKGQTVAFSAQHQTVIDQMKEAYYALDANLLVIEANAGAERYFAMTREALIGNDLRDLFPETRESLVWGRYRHVMLTGEQTEFRVKASIRGRPRMNIRAFPYDGGGVGVMFSPAQAEEEASMLQKRGAALLGAIACEPALSVAVLNARGGLELMDEAFCALTGFSRSQLETLTLAELVKIPDQTLLTRTMNATVRDDQPKAIDVTLLTRGGDAREVRLTMGAAAHDVAPEEVVVCAIDLNRLRQSSQTDV